MPFLFKNIIFSEMKKNIVVLSLALIPFLVMSQDDIFIDFDTKYREDQLYFGVTYNALTNAPDQLSQTGFSPGFNIGIIRDFPINTNRNVAFGLGLGYSINSYSQNLKISTSEAGNFEYEFLPNSAFQKNRFSYQSIDIPFEFRWRTSTAARYKFWRIYAGLKASYILSSKAFFESSSQSVTTKNISLKQWLFGLTLSAGYNNWNGYLYYGLSPLFEGVEWQQNHIDMKALKVGLMFYFL